MDSQRFDALTRSLAKRQTRRGVLGGLAALAAGAVGLGATKAVEAACPAGQVAVSGGRCVCKSTMRAPGPEGCPAGAGQTLCGGVAVDLSSDANNCGTCGNVCATAGACGGTPVCRAGTCIAMPLAAGTPCDDGNACTEGDVCNGAGGCAGTPKNCAGFGDQCNDGVCRESDGACIKQPKPNGTGCNDGNACTQTDTCQAGQCVGGNPRVCTASDQCHLAGTCDPATGECSNPAKPNGTACDDGNPNTVDDVCTDGVCAGIDRCAGVVCTALDQCHVAGACDPATGVCSNPNAANGTSCNDDNFCTLGDTCQAGVCQGGASKVCTASDQCHVAGTCDPATGNCSNPAKPDGTSCDDGNPATVNDVCTAGVCGGTDRCSGVVCTAKDQCHVAGVCDPATGVCSDPTKADGTSCDDGNACTRADTCQAGVCTGGDPVVCTASDACHDVGVCDHATGQCSNPAKPNGTACSDGNSCTQTDTCQNGVCTSGGPVECPPADQCHEAGVCDSETGTCSTSLPKADGTACTGSDQCFQAYACQAGVCTGSTPVTCTASDQCHTAGTCNPATGTCSNPAKPDGTTCDDGNPATINDVCIAGSCNGIDRCAGVTCTPQDQCHTAGTCNPETGVCSNPAKPNGSSCNDNNACTQTDTCQNGACVGSNPVTCTASDQCHVAGVCDPATGACSNPDAADGTTCNDDNPATSGDVCTAGVCAGVDRCAGVVCTAQDECHSAGVCDPATGTCSNPSVANGTSCGGVADGFCAFGTCRVGCFIDGAYYLPETVNPSNSCQVCAEAVNPTAWTARANGAFCADPFNMCMTGGHCQAGVCAATPVADGTVCFDTNPCVTDKSCQGGACVGTPLADGASCQDGNPCASGHSCQSGTCVSTPVADGASCDNLNPCTTGDTCQAGLCVGTPVGDGTICVDGQAVCHYDVCSFGCFIDGAFYEQQDPNPSNPCERCQPLASLTAWNVLDDGASCGSGQFCSAGVCVGTDHCIINGASYDPGTTNPNNPCEWCQPATNATNWTPNNGIACAGSDPCLTYTCQARFCRDEGPAANGTTCGDGLACFDGTCRSGCVIAGVFRLPGASNPSNACQSCQPATSTTAWSTKADGVSCEAGNPCTVDTCQAGACTTGAPATDGTACGNAVFCAAGVCGPCGEGRPCGCVIAGATYSLGATNPDERCESCQSDVSTTAWTRKANGTSCLPFSICVEGACEVGCFIDGVVYETRNENPSNPCEWCWPETSTTAWSERLDGTSCGLESVCFDNVCRQGCWIGDTFYQPAAHRPSNLCDLCDPGVSTTDWTGCDEGEACTTDGFCVPGCILNGFAYPPGTEKPGSPCEWCVPTASGPEWMTKVNGLTCAGGAGICVDNVCRLDGCYINGVFYPNGTQDPHSVCRSCLVNVNNTDWTDELDDTLCGDNSDPCFANTCQAGICEGMPAENGTFCGPKNVCYNWECVPCGGPDEACCAGVCDREYHCNPVNDHCRRGCQIDGAFYVDGAVDPNNQCEVCSPTLNPTGWSAIFRDIHPPCDLTDPCEQGFCDISNGRGVCVSAGPKYCPPQSQCHDVGTCDPATGICSNPAKPDGTACDDGVMCTFGHTCQAGVCTGGTAGCPAPDDCHTGAGTCDPETGVCSYGAKPDGTACTGGNLCRVGATCQAGVCSGGASKVCTAQDQCHSIGTCDAATGNCSNPPKTNGTACAGDDPCTVGETCEAGVCQGGAAKVCTASDQCHNAGVCDPETGVCSNPAKANGTTCNDGNACTQTDTCQNGTCVGGNPVVCTAQDQCHDAGVCNPATGVCSNPPKANGSACNGGDACTLGDTCQAGVCQAGAAKVCTASDQCHNPGTCNPATGVCSNPPKANGSACNDGNACTQTDTCQNGTCVGTNPVVCTATDQCHDAGVCNPATGVCSNPPKANGIACNDGNACTTGDTCQNGSCVGTPKVCTAQDQCHRVGTCDPATGICSNPTVSNGTTCDGGVPGPVPYVCRNGNCDRADAVCQAGMHVLPLDDATSCGDLCFCATKPDGTPVCVNPFVNPTCNFCESDDDCTGGDICTLSGSCNACNPPCY